MTEIVEYSETIAALAELRHRMEQVVYDVTTTKGLDVARKDRRLCVSMRSTLESKRVIAKQVPLERCLLIDAEAKRITAEILAIEGPIDAQVKAEEARKEAERLVKIEAERLRIGAIQGKLQALRNTAANANGMKSLEIMDLRNAMSTRPDGWSDEFAEYAPEACIASRDAMAGLQGLYDRVLAQEKVAAQLAADRLELDALRAAEQRKIAAEAKQRAAEDARRLAERVADDARIRTERAAEAKQRDAEEAKCVAELRAEVLRIVAERAAEESKANAARIAAERVAAAERAEEAARMKAATDRLDAERAALEKARREHEEFIAAERAAILAKAEAEIAADDHDALMRDIAAAEARAKPNDDQPTAEAIVMGLAKFCNVTPGKAAQWILALDRAELEKIAGNV